ncbi:unnamed protein product [Paramecium octaurelia]|uniref:Uncharacterized protein n=1 Tax=Paramecium octaurelia TaxID=43137 RepID=A0A8S1TY27_PAROT|nr:unnamed protein product [Paramecium octaurelia]
MTEKNKQFTDEKSIISQQFHQHLRVFHDNQQIKKLENFNIDFGRIVARICQQRAIFQDFINLSNQIHEFQQKYYANPSFAEMTVKKLLNLVSFWMLLSILELERVFDNRWL